MNVVSTSTDAAELKFTRVELLLMNNALNEVCNGIEIPAWEFPIRLGASLDEARTLLEQIYELLDDSPGAHQ